MRYDLDTWVNRKGTDCSKWDTPGRGLGALDVLPMSIADMDFPVPEPVVEALRKRVEHPVYGYTNPGQGVVRAVIERLEKKFDWKIQPSGSLSPAGYTFTYHSGPRAQRTGAKVLAMSPVYPHLPWAAPRRRQGGVFTRLKINNGRYEMDLDHIQQVLSDHRRASIMLCSPHNPAGVSGAWANSCT